MSESYRYYFVAVIVIDCRMQRPHGKRRTDLTNTLQLDLLCKEDTCKEYVVLLI